VSDDDDPPDEEHGPRSLDGVIFRDIEDINVAEWCPTPDGSGPPEQVWLSFKVKGIEARFVLRFKSPRTIGRLINNLRKHRDGVWPPQ
jgi:hypothetical protein